MSTNGGQRPNGGYPSRVAWARAIGDELIEFLKEHEREEHGGERCYDDTVGTLAFLCHCVGMHMTLRTGDDALQAFRDLVARTEDYNAIHAEHHGD